MTPTPTPFFEKMAKIADTAEKFKKVMQRRGLRRGRAKCPFCEKGFLHGQLAGRKDHMHMYCDGCDVRLMQ